MRHTCCIVRVHMVFAAADRRPLIPAVSQNQLWAYMHGIGKNIGAPILEIGGMPDHVHILFELPPTLSIASVAQKLKANSSRWLHQSGARAFAWQEGYGAFSVSASHVERTLTYIRTQAKHHAKRGLEEEFAAMLRAHGAAALAVF